ncbi:MAG: FAD/NAD(P)-binding protein [Burkholderia ambifaria]
MYITKNTERLTLAVIGGGAASVAFLHHLSNLITPSAAARLQVTVFEPRSLVGPGLAYQPDVDSVLLNRAVETMSVSAVDFSTFTSWVRWKSHHESELHELARRDPSSTYVSRPLFGRYLNDFFNETMSTARRKGLAIDVVHKEIRQIARRTRYRLIADDDAYDADSVVLAVGNTGQRDHYGLAGHERYIHCPYPVASVLEELADAHRIAIIGASLTAVDIAVSLDRMNSRAEIHMVSNTGLLPLVKGQQALPQPLRHLTVERLRALTSDGRTTISLRQLGRLIRAEFRAAGADWRALFSEQGDAVARLSDEIALADRERAWQTILVATNDIVEFAWHVLDTASQACVQKRFARHWLACRAPMPVENARVLARMLEEGRLKLMKTPIAFERTDPHRLVTTIDGQGCGDTYDYVVNATGAARDVQEPGDSVLIWQMLSDGLASRDWRGGIRVDFDTGAVIDGDGEPDYQLRALGHITSGTYFFVSSLEMVAKRARRIATDIASALAEEDLTLQRPSAQPFEPIGDGVAA